MLLHVHLMFVRSQFQHKQSMGHCDWKSLRPAAAGAAAPHMLLHCIAITGGTESGLPSYLLFHRMMWYVSTFR